MNLSTLIKRALLILAFSICYGCQTSRVVYRPEYRIPTIPPELLRQTEVPLVDWKGKTQKHVGAYVLDLHKAVDIGNTKLAAIKEFMMNLQKQYSKKRGPESGND